MYAEYTRPQLTFLALVPCSNISNLYSITIGMNGKPADQSLFPLLQGVPKNMGIQ